MEGTQTSLLVDIYQYLERNKKLGIEREELKRKEIEAQNTVHEATSSDDSPFAVENGTTRCDSIEESPEEVTCGHVEAPSSTFTVIPVDDDMGNVREEMNGESFEEMSLNVDDSSVVEENKAAENVDNETSKLLNEADKSEGMLEYCNCAQIV